VEYDRLFIEDLAESLGGPPPTPGAAPASDGVATTMAVGEEGDQPGDGDVTTMAVGEEGDQPDDHHDLAGLADRLAHRFGDRLDARADTFDARLDDVGARVDAFADHFAGLADRPTWGTADPVESGAPADHQGIAPGEPHPGDDATDEPPVVDDVEVKGYGDEPGHTEGHTDGYDPGYDAGYDGGLDADPVATAF
jgi:hypothetical protein